jgi:hypothetical protein
VLSEVNQSVERNEMTRAHDKAGHQRLSQAILESPLANWSQAHYSSR